MEIYQTLKKKKQIENKSLNLFYLNFMSVLFFFLSFSIQLRRNGADTVLTNEWKSFSRDDKNLSPFNYLDKMMRTARLTYHLHTQSSSALAVGERKRCFLSFHVKVLLLLRQRGVKGVIILNNETEWDRWIDK